MTVDEPPVTEITDELGSDELGSDELGSDELGSDELGSDELAMQVAALAAELRDMRQDMRGADERAAARERIIDRLHEDNQRLRAGDRQLVLRPVLTDLQRLRNDLLRQAGAVPGEMGGDAVAALLRSYAHSVELTLERGGVEVLHPAPGDPFDAARHRPQAVLAAPGPEADGTVADVLADGYLETVTDRVLTPATVRVRRWTQRQEDASA